MQAVILVGGEGTRLRPLTSTVPKPVVPLVDRPFITYMLDWLARHGVDDVILSLGFLADRIRDVLGDGSAMGLKLHFVEEPEPRGTAGALKYAEDLLQDRFLMLNGDVLSDMDLSAQIARHEETGAKGTLALVPVADPSAYGLVRTNADGTVREFVEKPDADQIDTNLISAGAYVLEREIVDMIPADRKVSIEREIWPRLVGEGLYAFAHDAYWLDIGTPATYLRGTYDILEGNVVTGEVRRIGERCEVAQGARVGSLAVLGDGVRIGSHSHVDRAVVLEGAVIGEGCDFVDCIVGPGAVIGDRTRVGGGAVLGAGVTVGPGNVLAHGIRVHPGTTLGEGAVTF